MIAKIDSKNKKKDEIKKTNAHLDKNDGNNYLLCKLKSQNGYNKLFSSALHK